MKILFLVVSIIFCMACLSCHESSSVPQNYVVVKRNGDTVYVKALTWQWDIGTYNVLFKSENGSQYIANVQDITIKED